MLCEETCARLEISEASGGSSQTISPGHLRVLLLPNDIGIIEQILLGSDISK